jgi:hypothetical protein
MNAKFLSGFLFALSVLFIGCAEDSMDWNSDQTGRLTVRLTDAPFPYDLVAEANVTVFKVEARKVSGEGMHDDGAKEDNDGEGNPFITLMEEEIAVNLLTLVNGVTQELADLEVPAGSYDLVRIYVKGVSLVLKSGQTFDFKVPSGAQTGIKVFIDPSLEVVGGLSADLLLDFDLSKSFVARGNIDGPGFNGFLFKPVIRASNTSTAGTLSGFTGTLVEEVETALEGTQVSVIAADTLYASAFSDADGKYAIMGIQAGTYRAVAEKEGFFSSDTVTVQIVPANKTVQDFLLETDPGTTESTDGN